MVLNLKESFRYQKFLDNLMYNAMQSIQTRSHCLRVTEEHCKSKANPEAEDEFKVVEDGVEFFCNDDLFAFADYLIGEKEKLTAAINSAKASVDFDIDAAVEANKYRHSLVSAFQFISKYKPSKSVGTGADYKFNVEGNQTSYIYEIITTTEDAYDRNAAKAMSQLMASTSEKTSSDIDAAMINTVVKYEPPFDVTLSFDDVVEKFLLSRTE